MREFIGVIVLGALVLLSFETRADLATITVKGDLREVGGLENRFSTEDGIIDCYFVWEQIPAKGTSLRVETSQGSVPGSLNARPVETDSPLRSFSCGWVMPLEPLEIDRLEWATQGYIVGK